VYRLSHRHVIAGYEMAQREMDEETLDALQALESVKFEREWTREFFFESEQIQIADNQRCGHRHTQSVDFDEEHRRCPLVRLWLRDAKRRG
jgi:hypothetical protein